MLLRIASNERVCCGVPSHFDNLQIKKKKYIQIYGFVYGKLFKLCVFVCT